MWTMWIVLLASLSVGQTPAEPWRTIETEHFRVHYPVKVEAWAQEAAGQLEQIRERVDAEVGFELDVIVDVTVMDPVSDANGSALMLINAPTIELWASPPAAESVIGHYRTWGELLLTHEYAHVAHLIRGSRNPLFQVLEGVTGIPAVARKAPRWVSEGYATVVEARLSGFGRPNADFRALLLRSLARAGRLPTYGELNGNPRFYGGSYAYLVGSAYLEWLEDRAGEGTLRDLWARMSAKKERSFDEAFEGVYGDSPARLYARFTAELTAEALRIEHARPVDEGTLWLDLGWYTGEPAISPDGEQVALVRTSRDEPSQLVIWSLKPKTEDCGDEDAPTEDSEERQDPSDASPSDEEASPAKTEGESEESEPTDEEDGEAEEACEDSETAEEKKRRELLEKDPEDVPAVPPKHPSRTVVHSRTRAAVSAVSPRWMPDGESLLFSSWQTDPSGRRRPDVYRWWPETGKEERVTHWADVRLADPFPDGQRAIGVRNEWGKSHLVIVDLATGTWEPLMEGDIHTLYDMPRVSPDGERVAWLEHSGSGWEVVIHDNPTRTVTRVGGDIGGIIPTHLAWTPDGQGLLASVGSGGFVEVHEVWGVEGARGQLTRTRGGAFAPSATEDAVFFLSMDDKGFELHRIAYADQGPHFPVAGQTRLSRNPPASAPAAPAVAAVESKPYGVGRQQIRALVGGTWSVSQAAAEIGIRIGDVIGRQETLVVASYGRRTGITGGLVGWEWRRLPVDVAVQGFVATEKPELLQRTGAVLDLSDGYNLSSSAAVGLQFGGFLDAPLSETVDRGVVDGIGSASVEVPGLRQVVYGQVGLGGAGPIKRALRGSLELRGQLGSTDGAGYSRGEIGVEGSMGRDTQLTVEYVLGASNASTGLDQYRLGGVTSSALPDSWEWTRVAAPAFLLGSGRGANRDALTLEYGIGGAVGAYAERHRMSEAISALGKHANTAVGARVQTVLPATPRAKLPTGDVQAGLACRVEDPSDGWADKPCQTLSDYGFWASVNWRL